MSCNLDFGKDFFDASIFPDNKGCALNAHTYLAIKGLFPIHTIIGRHLLFGVGQKRHVQLMFVPEFCLLVHAICAYTYGDGSLFLNLSPGIAKLGRLACSSGRVGFGIEKQDYSFLP